MKLGEALTELKKTKARLTRVIQLRKDNVFAEKGKKSKLDPKELSQEIDMRIEEIRKLKIKIQRTNLLTQVADGKISLAEAIIKVGDLRSRISNLGSLFERKRDYLFRDKDEKEKVGQLDERRVEDEIQALETERSQLDNKIQVTNWTNELLD